MLVKIVNKRYNFIILFLSLHRISGMKGFCKTRFPRKPACSLAFHYSSNDWRAWLLKTE